MPYIVNLKLKKIKQPIQSYIVVSGKSSIKTCLPVSFIHLMYFFTWQGFIVHLSCWGWNTGMHKNGIIPRLMEFPDIEQITKVMFFLPYATTNILNEG